MNGKSPTTRSAVVTVVITALVSGLFAAQSASARPAPSNELYTPLANHDAKRQIAELRSNGDKTEAAQIRAMIDTPQAVWFTAGTPRSVRQDVHNTVVRAKAHKTV